MSGQLADRQKAQGYKAQHKQPGERRQGLVHVRNEEQGQQFMKVVEVQVTRKYEIKIQDTAKDRLDCTTLEVERDIVLTATVCHGYTSITVRLDKGWE